MAKNAKSKIFRAKSIIAPWSLAKAAYTRAEPTTMGDEGSCACSIAHYCTANAGDSVEGLWVARRDAADGPIWSAVHLGQRQVGKLRLAEFCEIMVGAISSAVRAKL